MSRKDGIPTIGKTTTTHWRTSKNSPRIAPNLANAYVGRGAVRYVKNDYDRAMADYNRAIQLAPNLADAYVGRGLIWRCNDDSRRAMADYNQALELDPNYAAAYNNCRGSLLLDKNDYDNAKEDFERAHRIDFKYVPALDNLGKLWKKKKDYRRAVYYFKKALTQDPDDFEACHQLAWMQATWSL